MGTPGDKEKIRKVTELDSQNTSSDPHHTQSQYTETEMGFLEASLPPFGTIAEVHLPSPDQLDKNVSSEHLTQHQEEIYPLIDKPGPSGLQTPKNQPTGLSYIEIRKKQRLDLEETPKKNHTCQSCQRNYATLEKLNKHQQIHSQGQQHKCENCEKSFTTKFKLARHSLIHSDRKPFSCTVCDRTFHRKDHLKNHIKVHSPTKKIYLCEKPNCKKEYTSHNSYKKHLAMHAAEEGSLQCQICSNVFNSKDEILYHLKIHAGSRSIKDPNEKKYTCDFCERRFFTKKDVRRHLVVHTGMRDFLCQFCPQRFGRKDHLGRHIKKSHSRNLASHLTRTETVVKPEIKTESDMPLEPFQAVKVEMQEYSQEIIKTELEIPEFSEENLTGSIPNISLDDVSSILEMDLLDDAPSELSYLPTSSSQSDFNEILENFDESTLVTEGENVVSDLSEVLNSPELKRLLQRSDDANLPLPGFSQTFQSPPAPP